MARATATAATAVASAILRPLNKGRNKTRNAILVKTIKKYYNGAPRLALAMPRDSPTGSAQNKYANFGHKISDGEIPLNSFADFSAECTLLYFPPSAARGRVAKCDILKRFRTKGELRRAQRRQPRLIRNPRDRGSSSETTNLIRVAAHIRQKSRYIF